MRDVTYTLEMVPTIEDMREETYNYIRENVSLEDAIAEIKGFCEEYLYNSSEEKAEVQELYLERFKKAWDIEKREQELRQWGIEKIPETAEMRKYLLDGYMDDEFISDMGGFLASSHSWGEDAIKLCEERYNKAVKAVRRVIEAVPKDRELIELTGKYIHDGFTLEQALEDVRDIQKLYILKFKKAWVCGRQEDSYIVRYDENGEVTVLDEFISDEDSGKYWELVAEGTGYYDSDGRYNDYPAEDYIF